MPQQYKTVDDLIADLYGDDPNSARDWIRFLWQEQRELRAEIKRLQGKLEAEHKAVIDEMFEVKRLRKALLRFSDRLQFPIDRITQVMREVAEAAKEE